MWITGKNERWRSGPAATIESLRSSRNGRCKGEKGNARLPLQEDRSQDARRSDTAL